MGCATHLPSEVVVTHQLVEPAHPLFRPTSQESVHAFAYKLAVLLGRGRDAGDATGGVLQSLEVGLALVELVQFERDESDVYGRRDLREILKRCRLNSGPLLFRYAEVIVYRDVA